MSCNLPRGAVSSVWRNGRSAGVSHRAMATGITYLIGAEEAAPTPLDEFQGRRVRKLCGGAALLAVVDSTHRASVVYTAQVCWRAALRFERLWLQFLRCSPALLQEDGADALEGFEVADVRPRLPCAA